MTAYERVTARLAEVTGYSGRNGEWLCPAHDDRNPSLSVSEGDGKVVVCCHVGCSVNAIVEALGLRLSDLFDEPRVDLDRPQIVATYPYTDERGDLLYEVVRTSPKGFRQRRPDGQGGWEWKLNGSRRVPYRLGQVLRAVENDERIYIVEGEKDCDAIARSGGVATTCPGGAGKWRSEFSDYFRGAVVEVIADRDQPGYRHARYVRDALRPIADSVLVVQAVEGKDAADHLDAGHAVGDFQLINDQELDQLCGDATDDSTDVEPPVSHVFKFKTGSTFVLDDPAELDPVVGQGDRVFWASGEPLIVVGPPGVGKTTVAVQLVEARLGITDQVLGIPVKADGRPILYLALDRPQQIRRAMRRVFVEHHRDVLRERLVVWEGPLPLDLGRVPEHLLELVAATGAGTVLIDSLKDAAVKISDDEVGGNLNRALQFVVREGVEVAALHHQRKGQGGAKPTTLEDVYGSTWITAGAGSVVLLWGAAGDPLVELRHLKQPAAEIGPLTLEHDHLNGRTTVYRGQVDVLKVLRNSVPNGLDATTLARLMFETEKPNDTQRKKAERALERLVRDGLALPSDRERGSTGTFAGRRYQPSNLTESV